jgi:hypothetical protein
LENPRLECLRCHKPQVTCVCASIPLVDNRTRVLVLQHPLERLHPIGTARFASLGLRNAHVQVAWNAGARDEARPTWLSSNAALLYPTEDARDLRDVPEADRPRELLVIDGTWHTARTLFRDKTYLHALPRFRFLPRAPGRYRLRREPRADYVSTIEAIVEALQILEPDTQGLDALLAAFDAMIDRQISLKTTAAGRERKQKRPRIQRRTPRVLVDNFRDLVVVYGEPSRPRDESQREFVYWVAHAIGSGATFEQWIVPATGLPDREHLTHMGMSHDDFDRALSAAEFRSAWNAFLANTCERPIVAAWNQRTLDLLARTTGSEIASTSLKSAYRAVFGADAATLDDVVAQRALALEANALRGRASTRIASALAVARFLHARATTHT